MNKIRAFIVEDSPLILDNLTRALEEDAGVQVVGSAVDQAGALAWMDARTNGCDVVILDIFLRSGSGLGVLAGMTSYTRPPERVVLTNYATPDMRSRCAALGADIVFDKSSEIEELLAWFAGHRPALH